MSPLFNEDSKDRELNAVESGKEGHCITLVGCSGDLFHCIEHSKNILVDAWRLKQLHAHTSKPGHPYSKFGTGTV